MTSVAGFKKKRDRTKDRQRRKEKQQQRREHSDSESEQDIPDDAIYGPRGETKRQFDTRVGDQLVHDASYSAFQRRARARKRKPIEYEQTVYPNEHVLHVDASAALDGKDKIVRQLSFAPGVNVDDSTIKLITKSEFAFRANLLAIVLGDPSRTQPIDITDVGVEKLVKACPNLIAVTLHGTCNLGSNAFPAILKGCANIESVTISVAKSHVSKRTKLNEFTNWLIDKDFVPKLRYLEFRGVYLRRPALEIVFEYDGEAAFIRDMESVPLARVPKRPNATAATATASATGTNSSNNEAKAEAEASGEDAWEDEDDDEDDGIDEFLVSDDPRENARTFRRLGQQSALSDALGRNLYDFEMDSDYDDYDDYLDSDEEMNPQEMRKLLKLMKMMERGTGRWQ